MKNTVKLAINHQPDLLSPIVQATELVPMKSHQITLRLRQNHHQNTMEIHHETRRHLRVSGSGAPWYWADVAKLVKKTTASAVGFMKVDGCWWMFMVDIRNTFLVSPYFFWVYKATMHQRFGYRGMSELTFSDGHHLYIHHGFVSECLECLILGGRD